MESRQNIGLEEDNIGNIRTEFEKEELYKWFESRGLLSELRTYMRQLMVKALEGSNKNGKMSSTRKPASSPKLQAINLLLVDYLFHEDFLYTVSVFASEANILDSLPQYSRYVTETLQQHRWEPSSVPRFSRQETEDILDTLRLPPSHRDMQQTIRLYQESQDSLLTCVARTLASSHSLSLVSSVKETDTPDLRNCSQNGHQLWSQEIQILLLMAGIKLQHIHRMQQKWQLIINDAMQKAREECGKDKKAEQVEFERRLREEVEEELRVEQSKLELRESGLNNLADQLSEVHEDISHRLAQLQLQSEDLQERETLQQRERQLLDERLEEIQRREGDLQLAVASLSKGFEEVIHYKMAPSTQPQREVATLDASVQVSEPVATPGPQVKPAPVPGPQVDSTHTQTLDTVDCYQQTSSAFEPDPELLHQLQMEREKINWLQEENLELRAHSLQQRHRIDELTNRAASLSAQLEESQVALTALSARERNPPPPAPAHHSPPSVFLAPTLGFNNPQRLGAGEESLFTPRAQQAAPQPEGRRQSSRFAFSKNPNPTSEESSPTDEVVQNARVRIQQLEAESAAVQRNYQDFQTRLFNSDSVMFPSLDAMPRTADHLLRVRRHDMILNIPPSTHPLSHVSNYMERVRANQSSEEEDSGSDYAPFITTRRFENMSNARRLFTQRNIRHYERWKQLKKKCRKHNYVQLYNRRNNTSSEDEESYTINKRRYVIDKAKDIKKNQFPIVEEQNNSNEQHKNAIKTNNVKRNKTESAGMQKLVRKQNDSLMTPPILAGEEKESNTKEKSVALEKKYKEDKLRLEVEQSIKLIDSVKMLLEEPALNPAVSRTLSNASLAGESLPRDSDENTQHEIVPAENTPVSTVRQFEPVIQNEVIEKNHGRNIKPESALKVECKDLEDTAISHERDSSRRGLTVTVHHQEPRIDLLLDGGNDEENTTLPLTVRSMPLTCNISSQELLEPPAKPLADVAEHRSEERETTSVTSASDILRELNPSNGSSVSVGDGCVINSHSSDFWN